MKRLIQTVGIIAGLALLPMAGSAFAANYDLDGYTQEEFDALTETTVLKSEESPTGYLVTFRYVDPDAERVRIYGEWKFSSLLYSTPFSSEDKDPWEWENGDTIGIVWGRYGFEGVDWPTSWPTADMEKNEETGVWSYTIPLPNGTYAYRYYVGGDDNAELTDYTDAVTVADPANVNYLFSEDETGNEQLLTSVYVPYDEEKQSLSPNVEEEAPRDGENGTVGYDSVQVGDIQAHFAYYLPYGYDENREDPYPLLILCHGGGGYYGSWFTNGAVNIFDNLIAEGRVEPMIVITPDETEQTTEGMNKDTISAYVNYIVDTLLPYAADKFNASSDPSRRALAGLSMGGMTTGYALFHNYDAFDTFILMSPPVMEFSEPDYTIPELKEKKIFVGYGEYDHVLPNSIFVLEPDENGERHTMTSVTNEGSCLEYIYGLASENIPVMTLTYPYGHQWTLWRELLVDVCDLVLWK